MSQIASSSPWFKRPSLWLILSSVIFAGVAIYQYQRLDRFGRKMAEKELQIQNTAKILDEKLKIYQDYQKDQQQTIRDLEAKLTDLEAKNHANSLEFAQFSNAQNIERMHVAQYKQGIYYASQHLALTQDVNQTLAILQDVLDHLNQNPTKWQILRQALESDINRLRQHPNFDISQALGILDKIQKQYKQLSLVNEIGNKIEKDANPSRWSNFWASMFSEWRNLLRVESIKHKISIQADQAWLIGQRVDVLLEKSQFALYSKRANDWNTYLEKLRDVFTQYYLDNAVKKSVLLDIDQLLEVKIPSERIKIEQSLQAVEQL